MTLMKGNTIQYKIKYDEKKSEFAAYNVTFKLQKQERFSSNKQDKKQFYQQSYVKNMAKQYAPGPGAKKYVPEKKRNYKPFRQHKVKDVSKPLWHPQYMSVVLNGYFIKYHDNEGILYMHNNTTCITSPCMNCLVSLTVCT
eukprot:UN03683